MNIIELAKHVGGVADDQTVVLFHEELEAVARAIRAEAYQQGRNEMKEEAAKVASKASDNYEGAEIAAKIRGLK